MTLQPYQQRVVEEKAELDVRLDKLILFNGSPVYAALDAAERDRLLEQAHLMSRLSDVLGRRIAAFGLIAGSTMLPKEPA